MDDDRLTTETERWFLSRGIPHFIAEYSASRDVFTRAVPALTLILLAEVAAGLNVDWPWWQNTLAAGGGLALVLGVWAAVNRARGRPAFSRPDRVGATEVGGFVLVPALVPIVFGAHWGRAVSLVALNLVLLGTIYLVTSYGIIPMTRWATGKMIRELGALVGLLARALPMLLLFVTFLFVNTEVWQVAAALEGPYLGVVVGLFVILGGAFLFTRLPHEIERLGRFDTFDSLAALCEGTPAAPVAGQLKPVDLEPPPLTRRQRGNVALVVVFSEAIQVILVATVMGLFFVAFGLAAIRPEVVEAWIGADALSDPIIEVTAFGHPVVLTAALLRVAVFLAAFSGFYFTVYVITDTTYRSEFFDEVVAEVRQALAVRAAYLAGL
ncbi:MAG: hypothetical protein ACRD29_06995 [Acidimicrobiales bacterium]